MYPPLPPPVADTNLYPPACGIGGLGSGVLRDDLRGVVDRLRATAAAGRPAAGGAGHTPAAAAAARGRGHAAGFAWASQRATLADLALLVGLADQVARAAAGHGGCACAAVGPLESLYAAATADEPDARGPAFREGFTDGAREVLALVRPHI